HKVRFVNRIRNATRTQTVAEAKAHIIDAHDFANLTETRIKKAFLMMRQAPLGHDRTAAGDNAGDPVGGERDVAKQDPGMNGEIIDALLALLDQSVAINLPGEFLRLAPDLFQGLINRHRANWDGRVANNPFAGLVNVLAGRK